MNTEIQKVDTWYKVNGLRINISKTNYMHFAPRSKLHSLDRLTIKLNDSMEPLQQVHNTRFLGVNLDDKLSWSLHINETALKISKVIGVMSHLKFVLPSKILLLLYNSLILPHLSYGTMLWINASNSPCKPLVFITKRAILEDNC